MRSSRTPVTVGKTVTVWEAVADIQPKLPAVTQGTQTLLWEEFDQGADGIAQFLLDLGFRPGRTRAQSWRRVRKQTSSIAKSTSTCACRVACCGCASIALIDSNRPVPCRRSRAGKSPTTCGRT